VKSADTALLIIDVQVGMFTEPDYPAYQEQTLLTNLSTLIEKARTSGIPVIYVQHSESHPQAPLWPEGSGWPIHPAIAPQPSETIVHKKTPDSFYNTTLQQELESRGIKRLVIAGMQTEYCVDTTTRQAFSRGYDLVIVTDAHTTYNSAHLTAAQIIQHHNEILGGSFATPKTTAEVEFTPVTTV
jgi:aminoglycoside 6'-N-acetyltransferase